LSDDDHIAGGKVTANDAGGLKSVHAGHRNIHEYDVWAKLYCFFSGFNPVLGLAANGPVAMRRQQGANTISDSVMIIHEQDS
jgi:hypothetical protein